MKDKFYGERNSVSNSRFTFDGTAHESQDEITIVTKNVRRLKDNLVLIVGNNKLVYLKDWQAKPLYSHELGLNASAVKLNRKYFKPYTWKAGNFLDVDFEQEDTFDSLRDVAREQANQQTWKSGHYGGCQELEWLIWA